MAAVADAVSLVRSVAPFRGCVGKEWRGEGGGGRNYYFLRSCALLTDVLAVYIVQ